MDYVIYVLLVCCAVLAGGIAIFIWLDRKAEKAHQEWLGKFKGPKPWDHELSI